jgi:hypothetical protein
MGVVICTPDGKVSVVAPEMEDVALRIVAAF